MSASDLAARRRHEVPAWQKAIRSGYYAALLANARQAAATGTRAEVEAVLAEIDTALQPMTRHNNGGGAWKRWLGQVHRDLEWRLVLLSEAEARAEAQQWR